ncbi:DUF6063 family protein [Paenibacillus tarimensis]|uniref:DUF6063 family protein n=1 Tax=Paenibacillus tarimensis TaxID=416012 RepID=UPI001F2BEC23|nr:DUF6063 family protein [Paenibacillus tarimensis]MCF2945457.1 DUF6063 family protein [Paenibacillus tarimensis]
MNYSGDEVMKAFRIYAQLAGSGEADKESLLQVEADDRVRGLLDQFAAEADCVVLGAGDRLLLVPLVRLSPFHMSNESLKRMYLRGNAVNADLYLMYMAIIVFIGAFYDSYQTTEPTRNFLQMEEWMDLVQQRISGLKEHSDEELKALSQEYSYHWADMIEKWDAMDDVKETAKRQSGATISRVSFLDTVRRFLLDQELARQVGPDELDLTEKTKIIVQRYYMEREYNRGILEFLYSLEPKRKEET